MERSEILKQLNKIFTDVLDNDDIVLTPQTTAADVEEWDSLSHIQLIVSIEKHFKVKFTSYEIQTWKSIDDMIQSITNKLAA
ncbi:MAG: acyl carrier protein [Chitinophagaceae bacterium]